MADDDAQFLEALLSASLDRAAEVQLFHAEATAHQHEATAALGHQLESGVAAFLGQQVELAAAKRDFDQLRQAEVDKRASKRPRPSSPRPPPPPPLRWPTPTAR